MRPRRDDEVHPPPDVPLPARAVRRVAEDHERLVECVQEGRGAVRVRRARRAGLREAEDPVGGDEPLLREAVDEPAEDPPLETVAVGKGDEDVDVAREKLAAAVAAAELEVRARLDFVDLDADKVAQGLDLAARNPERREGGAEGSMTRARRNREC